MLLEIPEGMKEWTEEDRNEGKRPDKWKGTQVWSHMFFLFLRRIGAVFGSVDEGYDIT